MKKILPIILILSIVVLTTIGLVGCDFGPKKLDAPLVMIVGNTASWNADSNAVSYVLSINGNLIKVPSTQTTRKLLEGQTLKVRAVGDNEKYLTSDWSNMVSYMLSSGSGNGSGSGSGSGSGNGGNTTPNPTPTPTPSGAVDLNFLMINDTHGAFTDSDSSVSIGRVDTLLNNLESENGDYIFIQNGDAFQGSYVSGETYGKAILDALNIMELDAFVIGNHEFDWGLDKIALYADGNQANGEANFPFLGANIYYENTTTRPDWIKPYTIVEQDGLKVGIIGVIGYGQESSILTRYAKPYDFAEPLPIIREWAGYLRNTMNCDSVVVSTHDYDEGLNVDIASLSGQYRIDAIFCGHTHYRITESVVRTDAQSIPVVQCRDKNQNAQEVVLRFDGTTKDYVSYYTSVKYPADYAISSRVQTVIDSYQELIDLSKESLGYTSSYIDKGTLGSYATEALLDYTYPQNTFGSIDLAIINTGGVRATIDSGSITRASVFEVFPFNNMVVIVNIRGSLLKSLCSNNSGFFYIAGDYTTLSDNTMYQLAVIDYVFEGTRYYQFEGCQYIETGVLMRDLLIEYIETIY